MTLSTLLLTAVKDIPQDVSSAGWRERIAFAHPRARAVGPFPLFSDDFRPANVLTNADYNVVGAIDWEFTYAAPVEFSHSPPFWLLLEMPEYWPEGLDDWTQLYEKRLVTFLKVMREREDAGIQRGVLKETQRLSDSMRRNWDSGDFWVTYAARKSWAFDMIYWAKIDRRFFGDGDLEDRIQLLTLEEREELDGFVERKLREKEERTLVDWEVGEVVSKEDI